MTSRISGNEPHHTNPPLTLAQAPQTATVPRDKTVRDFLRKSVQAYVSESGLIPPLSLEELREHARQVAEQTNHTECLDFITVLVGNSVWESTVASTPFSRRVLLLPHCMRTRAECPADMDEFGLLCEQCGRCVTGDLQAEAEDLGYVVLIAEGTTVVTKLLESGQVDCVIGVSCLDSLERSFPYTAAAAVPGIAIPLFKAGCDQTRADTDWIREAIHLESRRPSPGRMDLDALRSQVNQWFENGHLSTLADLQSTQTERIAYDWMQEGGKRWRPFLAAAVYKALSQDDDLTAMQKLAVAVECFHKASLVHDDIEDDDDERYGHTTLHKRHGIAIALNCGDLLLGEGYRLIADSGQEPHRTAHMLSIASRGHKDLCLGQGEELNWTRHPTPLTVDKAMHIFKRKTAPAFEVALNLGAVAAGATDDVCRVLSRYSEALGVAYQIRDDIEDFHEKESDNDIDAMRPSLMLALALECLDNESRLHLIQDDGKNRKKTRDTLRQIIQEKNLEESAWTIFTRYRDETLRTVRPLRNQALKSLLFRVAYKILGSTTGFAPDGSAPPKKKKEPE